MAKLVYIHTQADTPNSSCHSLLLRAGTCDDLKKIAKQEGRLTVEISKNAALAMQDILKKAANVRNLKRTIKEVEQDV